ncbi:MAG: hypothetical protein XD93_0954 [candidate division WS6 bacterium 34_10]|uniref:Uncharacterized protein n=1 Tax=candidate division WS6 bacterium 34_10 TaxID=1641389 RepID=A0A101HH82_9BACT|nr:MAG: hypothetical protein XD93_0954 [candidate division WS6 bacterium 34_10]
MKVTIDNSFDSCKNTKKQIIIPIIDSAILPMGTIIGQVRINKDIKELKRLDDYIISPVYRIKKRNEKGLITEIEIIQMELVKYKTLITFWQKHKDEYKKDE